MPKKKEEKPVVDDKFQQVEVNAKNPRTVVLMLDSPEQPIVCKACQALQKYMEKSDQNCVELQEMGVIQRLVHLLNASEDKVIHACVVLCLAVMAPILSVRRILLKLDCVAPLLAMLKPEEEIVILEKVTAIIANLAEEYTFKQKLYDGGVCPLLLHLLAHADCDVLRNSVRGLSLMTQHHSARAAIAEENGFQPLLALLESEYPVIQEYTLHTLEHCLHDERCRESFQTSGGLAKITEFLSNKEWGDLHVLAVDVLSLCLLAKGGIEALLSSDCLQRLLESINDSTLPQMKSKATSALARAAHDGVSQKILHEQEAEKVFINLLSSQDEAVCTVSCEALTALSSLTSSRQTTGREGGVAALVGLLQHASASVRTAAVHALSSIIYEAPTNCIAVGDCNGIEPLVALLLDDQALCRLFAASCIIHMSTNGSLRCELLDSGAVANLSQCLTHPDMHVVCRAAEAIALLATDATAREQFPVEKVSDLLELLVSSHTEARRTASWALSILAQNRHITDGVFANKGIRVIQKLSSESTHRDIKKYSSLALRRLLNGNPSAKYALTGSLTPLDELTEREFWDTGMAEAVADFPTLEDIVNKPADLNRPVLTVSLVNRPPPPPPQPPPDDAPKDEGESLSTSSTRTKSRQGHQTSNTSLKSKKANKIEKQGAIEAEESHEVQQPRGLLAPDAQLWEHIAYTHGNIQPLLSVREQAEQLAIYVSQSMGGALRRSTEIQFEYELADTQANLGHNIVPLGTVKKGMFQHRALLYKVLADHLGIPCSLTRGQYNCHWNRVTVDDTEWIVDIMYLPGKLMEAGGTEAASYTTL